MRQQDSEGTPLSEIRFLVSLAWSHRYKPPGAPCCAENRLAFAHLESFEVHAERPGVGFVPVKREVRPWGTRLALAAAADAIHGFERALRRVRWHNQRQQKETHSQLRRGTDSQFTKSLSCCCTIGLLQPLSPTPRA